MNKLIVTFLMLLSSLLYAQDTVNIKAIVHIEQTSRGMRIFSDKGTPIPTIPASKEIKEKLSAIKSGTEALVEGHIHYELISGNDTNQFKPFFVVSKITPISLKDLGQDANKFEVSDSLRSFEFENKLYAPPSIPVTTEVASAITMTTALMLMNELSSGNGTDLNKDYRNALFLSTGAMATLLFIYEQAEGKTKP